MITLCYQSLLLLENSDLTGFKPSFLEWCDDWGDGFEIMCVIQDLNPGYQVEACFDFEVSGLSQRDEALWILAWGKSSRKHPEVFPEGSTSSRVALARPYAQHSFAMEVSM